MRGFLLKDFLNWFVCGYRFWVSGFVKILKYVVKYRWFGEILVNFMIVEIDLDVYFGFKFFLDSMIGVLVVVFLLLWSLNVGFVNMRFGILMVWWGWDVVGIFVLFWKFGGRDVILMWGFIFNRWWCFCLVKYDE